MMLSQGRERSILPCPTKLGIQQGSWEASPNSDSLFLQGLVIQSMDQHSLSLTWELPRNADSQAPAPDLLNQDLHFNKLPRRSHFENSFEHMRVIFTSGLTRRGRMMLFVLVLQKRPVCLGIRRWQVRGFGIKSGQS